MRILQILPSLNIGGAEKLVTDLSPLLAERGHQVDVLVFARTESFLYDVLVKAGIHVTFFGNSVYSFRYIWKLRKIISKYDIVHAHLVAPQLFVAIASCLVKKPSRIITTEHSTNNWKRHSALYRRVDRWMYHQYDSVISISQPCTDALSAYLHNKVRIKTIRNGIDIEKYTNAKSHSKSCVGNTPGNAFVVLMVGSFRVAKDQATLIKSFTHLPPQCHLWLAGVGETMEACQQLTAKLQLQDRIHFLGLRSDVAELLKTADVAVLSSHWEGLPLSAVEGMAAGKPLAASNVPGLSEVVDGYGILFEHQNDKQLASIIERLYTDMEYYKHVATKCVLRAKEFDINHTVREYEEIYRLL